MSNPKNNLSQELTELFDLRKAKNRDERKLAQEALEAQKDIRLITLMFRDGIPDVVVKATDGEDIVWDSKTQTLLYQNGEFKQPLESSSREIMVRMRPHLADLVKKAKDFYAD